MTPVVHHKIRLRQPALQLRPQRSLVQEGSGTVSRVAPVAAPDANKTHAKWLQAARRGSQSRAQRCR